MDPTSPAQQRKRPPIAKSMSTTSLMGIDNVPPYTSPEDSQDERASLASGSRSDYGTVPRKFKGVVCEKRLVRRIKYYIPSLGWIPEYSLSLFAGDFLAGLTVASMLIPQSISYATSLANMSPLSGLFSASVPALAYAMLGTSRQLNVAPEAALSLIVGQTVRDMQHDYDPDMKHSDAIGLAVSTVITFQVGLITFLLGFFRLGFIDVVLSRALLRGFITAIAVIISIEQLIPMLGLVPLEHTLHPSSTIAKFIFLVKNLDNSHYMTAIISFSTLLVLVGARNLKGHFKKYWFIYRVPEVLLVVVLSTLLCYFCKWDMEGVDILGDVPIKTGKHFFDFPVTARSWKFLRTTTSTSALISVVGYLDSIVAAKQNSARFGYTISPNRELVALGAANLIGSFIPGTLPAYGSITRSRINADVGGRTQMASIVCSTIILLVTFFCLPWLYYLPKCVLAAIIGLVVFSLLHETPHDVKYYWKMRSWVDLTMLSLTLIFSIIWNVEVGIVASVVISLVLVLHRASKARMTILGRVPGTDRWKPINETPEAEEDVPGVLIVRIRELSLNFANTAQLKERLRRLELYGPDKSHPSDDPRRAQAQVLVFHVADVEQMDAQATQIFEELLEEYLNRGVSLYFAHVRPPVMRAFKKAGVRQLLGEEAFLENVADVMTKLPVRSYAPSLGGAETPPV
ncbi:sulfate transporter family-domain-containing protein [Schizophyllum amplum]|uniref:Sulfate transporter family-domain-containing protein n=1 Tax=Schizophyllum amplum TaxID=97359 RepID=A0A550CVW5_9AGAR|nr:sulfate transporter family-domain-containing protein [Auriculariopsis ampla]